jgi:hypothetical protein
MSHKDLKQCQTALYEIGHEQTNKFAQDLEDGLLLVRVMNDSGNIQGMHNQISGLEGNTIFVVKNVVENMNKLELALVLFAEFQHTPSGGLLNEVQAQDQFVEVRNNIPPEKRTDYINALGHGRRTK